MTADTNNTKLILMAYLELTAQYNDGRICAQEFADKAVEIMYVTVEVAVQNTVDFLIKEMTTTDKPQA